MLARTGIMQLRTRHAACMQRISVLDSMVQDAPGSDMHSILTPAQFAKFSQIGSAEVDAALDAWQDGGTLPGAPLPAPLPPVATPSSEAASHSRSTPASGARASLAGALPQTLQQGGAAGGGSPHLSAAPSAGADMHADMSAAGAGGRRASRGSTATPPAPRPNIGKGLRWAESQEGQEADAGAPPVATCVQCSYLLTRAAGR